MTDIKEVLSLICEELTQINKKGTETPQGNATKGRTFGLQEKIQIIN